MAYNEKLADRVREIIAVTHTNVEEKKIFGGLCFMVNDKMCAGVKTDSIMVRVDTDNFDEVLEKEGFTAMEHNGRVMKGFGFVTEDALATKKKLEYWINLALQYNSSAPASKKKKKK